MKKASIIFILCFMFILCGCAKEYKQDTYYECYSIAIICKSYYKVFENCKELWYKDCGDKFYIKFDDGRESGEREYAKNVWCVLVSYK